MVGPETAFCQWKYRLPKPWTSHRPHLCLIHSLWRKSNKAAITVKTLKMANVCIRVRASFSNAFLTYFLFPYHRFSKYHRTLLTDINTLDYCDLYSKISSHHTTPTLCRASPAPFPEISFGVEDILVKNLMETWSWYDSGTESPVLTWYTFQPTN